MRRFTPSRALHVGVSLLGAVSLLIAVGHLGCSDNNTLGAVGAACDTDDQCSSPDLKNPIVCKCVRRRNPDEEGPDEILAHGKCEPLSYKCTVLDGGGDAPVDTGSDAAAEVDAADVKDAADAPDVADAKDAAADAADGSDALDLGVDALSDGD